MADLVSVEKGLLGGYPLGGVAPSALAEGVRLAGLAGGVSGWLS